MHSTDFASTMAKTRLRRRVGDVFRIPLRTGFAYVQYVWEEKGRFKIGPLVRVLPGTFIDESEDLGELVRQPELFCAFYPIYQLAPLGFASYAENHAVPERFKTQPLLRFPKQYRMTKDNRMSVSSWAIWDGTVEQVFSPLPKEYWCLPIVQLLTGNLLAVRIEAGWVPSDGLD